MDEAELHHQLEQLHTLSYGWALNCCASNPNDAEDILQTVYQRIFEGRARYDGRSAFKTWLFAVIRYTVAGERRRRWIRLLRLGGYQKEHERDSQPPDRGEAVEADEMAGIFRASLQKLPRRQSEVLHLVFINLSPSKMQPSRWEFPWDPLEPTTTEENVACAKS
jgi:RNA polymerase sigma-70 factor (ECF subfamily)